MTLPVRFHRAARAEFIDAAVWYESKRPGLGDEFIAEIERCVTLIAAQPQLYAEVHNRIRRLTARRFPYSIYFRPEAQRIVVLAIFHGSRDPMIWQRRG
ncbi:MAG: type II toxin-antitoxin system RelE/ParE family toxin [Gammaproteobacteria bacterium]